MSKKFKIEDIDWSLYAIIDKDWLKGRSIQNIAEKIILGGAGVLQYRDKVSETGEFYREALKLRKITKEHNVPFIINDRVDIAIAVEADGIHLGQDDLPLEVARKIVGEKMILGSSVSNLFEFEKTKNADYLGVGAIYPTRTKKDAEISGIKMIREIRSRTNLPIVGIGGITVENLAPVILAGGDGVAVISAIMDSENVEAVARSFTEAIRRVRSTIKHD